VTGPTESNDVTSLAWKLGKSSGLKLIGTYQLPRTKDGAHQVVFVVKGAVTTAQQDALRLAVADRSGGMTVEIGQHPKSDMDLEGGSTLAATFSPPTGTRPVSS
jgi:hypothetical protein